MHNSVFLSFFAGLYLRLKSYFQYSVLKKIQDLIAGKLKKSSERSFFVSFFTKAPNCMSVLDQSLLYQIWRRVLDFFARAVSRLSGVLKNSRIIAAVLWFYQNLFFISIRVLGVMMVAAVLVYTAVSAISGALTAKMLVILAVAGVLGLLCVAVNLSLYAIFKNSWLVKKVLLFFDVVPDETKNTSICPGRGGMVFSVLLGVLLGVLAWVVSPVFALAALCGGFGILLILTQYTYGVYLAAVLFPFLPTMALVGIIMTALLGMGLRAVFDKRFCYIRTNLDFLLILFAGILVISALSSFALENSILVVLVYLAFIASYFLIVNTVTTKKQFYVLLSLLAVGALLVALYGIYQYVFGFSGGDVWIDNDMFSDIETRVVSTFENPNVLGEYLLLIIPVTVALVWSAPKNYNRFYHLLITGALMLCMIFTFSRGNWIGLMVAFFLFFAFYDRKFIWFGILLLLLSPLFLPDSIINRFMSVGDMKDTSTSYRVNIWFGTLAMLKDYWFCGIGPGTEAFNIVYPYYAYSGVVAPHSHNLFLQILVEDGIMGFLVFLSILIVYFKSVISCVVKAKRGVLKATLIGLGAGMAGFLVQGLFDNVWYNYRIVLFFFLALGIAMCGIRCLEGEEEPRIG